MESKSVKLVFCTVMTVDLSRTVLDIANERMIDVTKVSPYLMKSPGLGKGFHEGATLFLRSRPKLKPRQRRDPRAILFLLNRVVDHP